MTLIIKSLKKIAGPAIAGHSILQPKEIRNSKEAYSPRNNRVKMTPPVSKLNPLISSLSPSEKSNGARLVSARRHQINKTKKIHPPE